MAAKSSFSEIIKSQTPVLVDFYADWCGPCHAIAPILKDVKRELGDKVKIVKIDVDKNNQLASKLQVRSIPTIMLFQNGELKWRAMGVQPKEVLKQQVEALL
ncbi:MAG TPA: thioredoxin [Phaeodactylibacter sp.]|nr:thioredoxin [Phaeodactylibacter sp.]